MPSVVRSQWEENVDSGVRGVRADLFKTHVQSLAELGHKGPDSAAGEHACLTILLGPDVGRTLRLGPGSTLIGRSPTADLILAAAGVSREHVEVNQHPNGSVWLRDCTSTNGTLVNNQRIEGAHLLADGDQIQIGTEAVLKFALRDPLEEQLQKSLYASAVRDPLTRLYNRRYLEERMQQELSYSARHKVPYALLVLDLDHFKRINDTYGHDAGDEVLRAVSAALAEAGRSEEVLARVGGEEFVVSMLGSTARQALGCAERIRSLIEGLVIEFGGQKLPVTASIGVASTDLDGYFTSEELLRQADQRLYSAKRSGRNCVCAYQSAAD